MEVTTNGVDYSSDGVQFMFLAPMHIESVTPALGPEDGGTVVTVRGAGFSDAAAARCRFGGAAVPARRVARGVLECVAPRAGAAGYAAVEVSMNARDYTSDGVHFEYRPPAHVRALAPSAGPAGGGSLVGVAGGGFSQRAALL